VNLRRLADHPVQRPKPTHVLWLATFFIDAASASRRSRW
jgi:hypothetical protein